MKHILVVALFVFTLLWAIPAGSQTEDAEFIQTVLAAIAETKTVSADFTQEMRLSVVQKPNIVKGHLYYRKPDRLRWEQKEPAANGFVLNGTQLKKWKGREKDAQNTSVSKEPVFGAFATQILAWCRGDAEWLRKRYSITVVSRKPPVLRLVPLIKAEKKHLESVTIGFSDDGRLVQVVEVQTADKDSIRTTFVNTVVNQPLPEDLF